MNERVLAITVCYNPECDLVLKSTTALMEQGCDVLLIDNGSNNVAELRELNNLTGAQDLNNSIILHELGQNFGLGAAHNAGIKYAKEHAYEYVLIMDQDSIPLSLMVSNLLAAHQLKSSENKRVSATGVTYLNADNGNESFFIRFGKLKFVRYYCQSKDQHNCIEADFLISSGSLISLAALDKVGLMDESLFIDHVDTEWFLRAKSYGFKAYGVCDALMQHGLGEQTHELNIGGRKRNVPQHKPFRYYYIFRNSILLYKRPYPSALWKWNDVQRLGMIFIMFGFFKSPRLDNLVMMLKGTWDGLRGKSGRVDHA